MQLIKDDDMAQYHKRDFHQKSLLTSSVGQKQDRERYNARSYQEYNSGNITRISNGRKRLLIKNLIIYVNESINDDNDEGSNDENDGDKQ
nr:11715_t:CDS:2 [Entrophospora candida]CAG8518868.1 11709_t:CDS:2 [Entrophospora candida]